MRRTALAMAVVSAMALVVSSGAASTVDGEFIDSHAIWESRAGSIDLPAHGIRISHVEGDVAIERIAGDEGESFYVMQEVDGYGRVRFAGFACPDSESAVEELFGTLRILPDGTLKVEYDAIGMEIEEMSVSVTRFAIAGGVLVMRSVCDCSDPSINGCNTNRCNEGLRCSQDPQDPSPNKCGWRSSGWFVQAAP